MRVATWNVNSLRSRTVQLLTWLVDREIDVAVLQETKCRDSDFPFAALESYGYEAVHHGSNHWNGVAILSRVGLKDVSRGLDGDLPEQFAEPRLIAATCGGVRCWSVYVPNGRSIDDPQFIYKLLWLDRLRSDLDESNAAAESSLVMGDFNVGMTDLDFYDARRWLGKKHATTEERVGVQRVIDLGFTDLARARYPADPMFTWWNHAASQFARDNGLRIDLALGSARVTASVRDAWVDTAARDPLLVPPRSKPSDHAPLVIDLV